MSYAHLDRADSFIADCEKLHPLSQAEASGLLAAMRMLDRQEPNTMTSVIVPSPSDVPVYASNIPGTALGITYREVGDRVQILRCQRR
jgi:hypothetical protein